MIQKCRARSEVQNRSRERERESESGGGGFFFRAFWRERVISREGKMKMNKSIILNYAYVP